MKLLNFWKNLSLRKKIQYGITAGVSVIFLVVVVVFIVKLWAVTQPITNQATATYTDAQGQVKSAQSNIVTTELIGDTQAPTVPTNLTAKVISSSQVNLSWTASTDNIGVTGYYIYRNNIKIGNSAATSYSDTGLAPSTTYSYQVSAYDAAGNESAKSIAVSVTTLAVQQVIISNVKVITSATQATITWVTNIPTTSQVKYGRTTSYGSTTPLDSNLVTITGLSKNTWYYYQIISTADSSTATYSGKFKTKTR